MLSLDDPNWRSLNHAYGDASDIPSLLRQAEALPPDIGNEAEPYFSLWSALCHQFDIYTASYAAFPHLVRIVEENPSTFRWTMLGLALSIEISRQAGRGPSIPDDLHPAYDAALRKIPVVATQLLQGPVGELDLRVILASCAAAKGYGSIAEAIMQLEPDKVRALAIR